jgi:hypothetical protein
MPAGEQFMSARRFALARSFAALALLLAVSAHAAAQQPVPARIRGTIASVDGAVLTIKPREGADIVVRMADDMRVIGTEKISLSDIKVGAYIGTTTEPGPDGGAKAVEVHVFLEDMRGVGEGSRPLDRRPNSTMTNATVAETVAGNDGHILTVKYKDGEKKVLVSPDTPVMAYVPADKSVLKAGVNVVASMKKLPDGSFETGRVTVGRDD